MTGRARAAGALAALALGVAACSYETGAEDREADTTASIGDDGPARTAPAAPAATVPDPGVLGGSCGSVTYTPPTATEPFSGELCRPASPEARDVGIILVHGGGGIAGDATAMTAWEDQYGAAGYTTLSIDYKLFDPGVQSPVFPQPEQNVKAAVQYLRGAADALGLDPERIVVHGASAGARLGAVAFTTAGNDRYAGSELWGDIDDTVDALIGYYSTYDGTMQYDSQYYGGPRDDPSADIRANWVAADSIVNAADPEAIHGPVALFTGALDWSELATQQDALAAEVQAAGYEANTHVSPGGEHGYDAGPTGLTPAGLEDAAFLVTWLDSVFPQQ
jgi:acetyl esterase/lipase